MYIMSTGANAPNGDGITIQYVFGNYQIIVSTNTIEWITSVSTEQIKIGEAVDLGVTWHKDTGIQVSITMYGS